MRLERHNIYSLHHPIHLSKTAVSRSSLSTGGGLYVRERRVSTYFLHFLASFFISALLQLFRSTCPSSVPKDSQKEPPAIGPLARDAQSRETQKQGHFLLRSISSPARDETMRDAHGSVSKPRKDKSRIRLSSRSALRVAPPSASESLFA